MSHRAKRDVIKSQYLELLGNIGDVESYHILNDLRRCVDFFLCESYQKEKFNDSLFSSIMEISADKCENFSAKLAAQCFDALEKITKNIILFKWRRTNEYATISTNTPFYLHKLSPTLIGFEKILENIGYVFDDDGQCWRFNVGPVAETLKFVEIAVDCFVASVECQIIETVKNLLVADRKNISWSKILFCRRNCVGGAEQCAQFYVQQSRTILKQEKDLISFNDNRKFPQIVDAKKRDRSKTVWYTTEENGSPVDSSRTLPSKSFKNDHITPKELNFSSSSTLPIVNHKITRLPRIDGQHKSVNSYYSPKTLTNDHRHRSSASSGGGLDSYLHKLQPELNDLSEKIRRLRVEAGDVVVNDGRECPRCRMINRQKNVLICAFCSYYFPV